MEDRAKVRVLPPLIPLAAMCVGLLIHLAYPIGLGISEFSFILGVTIAALSVALAVAAASALALAETALDVRKATTVLVQIGAFGISRNPLYLALMLLCFGVALVLDSIAVVVTLLPAGSLLCVMVIKPEERYLEGKFGDAYLLYKARVPRWL